jgi:hypothetical protein
MAVGRAPAPNLRNWAPLVPMLLFADHALKGKVNITIPTMSALTLIKIVFGSWFLVPSEIGKVRFFLSPGTRNKELGTLLII